jgi:hypothetical protein
MRINIQPLILALISNFPVSNLCLILDAKLLCNAFRDNIPFLASLGRHFKLLH